MFRPLLSLTFFLALVDVARADNWPAWRGPTGQGYCAEENLPLTWSPKENVKWKIKLAEFGNSTPIVWQDRIFLTEGNRGGTVRSLLCLDRADGKLLWKKDVAYEKKEVAWSVTYYASASPATDGERVVVSFGSAGMYCFDFAGKELWKRTDLGHWTHTFGNASSPIFHGDTVILWCGPDPKLTKLLAVNKKTGDTVWEHKEKSGSWSTPVVVKAGGQDQLLLGMSYKFKGFDPASGKELWSCGGLNELVYTSALYDPQSGIAVAMSGYNKDALAVKLGGSGDITKDRLWHHPMNTQRVGSGIIVGEHVYILEEPGVPHCYELKTGTEVWNVEKRPGGSSWSSMVLSGKRLYVMCQDATTLVFAASPKYELLATNRLLPGERTNASIAVSNGDLFLRTSQNLWCIRQK